MLSPQAPVGKDGAVAGAEVPPSGGGVRTGPSPAADQHGSRATIPRRWLTAARFAWVVLAVASLALFVDRYPMHSALLIVIAPAYVPGLARLGLSTADFRSMVSLLDVLTMVCFTAIGLVIFLRKSNEWTALVTSLALITFGAMPTFLRYSVRVTGMWNQPDTALLAIGTALSIATLAIFPDGRFFPRWAAGLTAVASIWAATWFLLPALNPYNWPFEQGSPVLSVFYTLSAVAIIYRYKHTASVRQRQQMKWVLFAFAMQIPLWVLSVLPLFTLRGWLTLQQYSLASLVGGLLIVLVELLIPLGFAIAILRYRLWDIDVIISRTLVYLPLTGILAGVYAASIAVLQRMFQAFTGQKSDAAVVITTLLIVAVFSPLKDALQHAVDRRYRERRDPLLTLEAWGRTVRAVVDVFEPRRITRELLDTAAAALGCRWGAIYIEKGERAQLMHRCGDWQAGEAVLEVPLVAHGVRLGYLQLAARRDETPYSQRDCQVVQQAIAEVAGALYLAMVHPMAINPEDE